MVFIKTVIRNRVMTIGFKGVAFSVQLELYDPGNILKRDYFVPGCIVEKYTFPLFNFNDSQEVRVPKLAQSSVPDRNLELLLHD